MQFRGVTAFVRQMLPLVGMMGLSIVLTSCGKKAPLGGPQLPVTPVSGSVFINGKPAEGVTVRLYSDKPIKQPSESRGKIVSQGVVDEEGNFQIQTYAKNDGAPAASYKLGLTLMVQSGFSKANDPVDHLAGEFADHNQNAENDSEQFTVTVPEWEGEPKPITIPRIDLDIEGFGETDEEE